MNNHTATPGKQRSVPPQEDTVPEVVGRMTPTAFSWTAGILNVPTMFRKQSSHLIEWRGSFAVEILGKRLEGCRLDPSFRLRMPKELLNRLGGSGADLELVARPGTLILRRAR